MIQNYLFCVLGWAWDFLLGLGCCVSVKYSRCESVQPDLGEYVRLSFPVDPLNHGSAFLEDEENSDLDEDVDFSVNRVSEGK
jgi:hypothetical protein